MKKFYRSFIIQFVVCCILVFMSACGVTENISITEQTDSSSVVEQVESNNPISENNKPSDDVSEILSESLLKVHYIDVGQGDSSFVELPNGETILIDAGIFFCSSTTMSPKSLYTDHNTQPIVSRSSSENGTLNTIFLLKNFLKISSSIPQK